jgi:hypothetical protein
MAMTPWAIATVVSWDPQVLARRPLLRGFNFSQSYTMIPYVSN